MEFIVFPCSPFDVCRVLNKSPVLFLISASCLLFHLLSVLLESCQFYCPFLCCKFLILFVTLFVSSEMNFSLIHVYGNSSLRQLRLTSVLTLNKSLAKVSWDTQVIPQLSAWAIYKKKKNHFYPSCWLSFMWHIQ